MSVIIRDLSDEKLYLYSKGADSIIMKRLDPETPVELLDETRDHLRDFSQSGLRTLAIAYKELDEKEFLEWNEKYTSALLAEYNVLNEEDPKQKIDEVRIEIDG